MAPRPPSQPPAHRSKPTHSHRPMPSSSSSPTASTRARKLFRDFERTLAKPRADMESKARAMALTHSPGVKKFKEEYFNNVRAQWEVKLQEAGLRMDEWIEVTKEDEIMIGDVLGGGEAEGTSVQPRPQPHQTQPPPTPQTFQPYLTVPQVAPSFSASTRSTNLSSSSYAVVDPNEFNSDDDYFAFPGYFLPVATSHDLTSDDDDAPSPSVPGPSRKRSHTQTQANTNPIPMTSTRTSANNTETQSLSSSVESSSGLFGYGFAQEDHHAHATNPHKNGATTASQHPSSSNPPSPPSAQTQPIPAQKYPYIGPSLSDPSEPIDEEQSFERYKMVTRMQKIVEFHEAAAVADVRLAMRIWLARKAHADGAPGAEEQDVRSKGKERERETEKGKGRRSKHDDAPMVEEHQRRMMQLQMEKEEERKAIVKAERTKRRAALSLAAHTNAANGKRPSPNQNQNQGTTNNPPAWTHDIETHTNALVKERLSDMNRLLADEQGLFGDESASGSIMAGLDEGWTNGNENDEANEEEEEEEEEAEAETGWDVPPNNTNPTTVNADTSLQQKQLQQKRLEEDFLRKHPNLRHRFEGGLSVGGQSASGSAQHQPQPQPQLQAQPKQAMMSRGGHPAQNVAVNGMHGRRMSNSTPSVPVPVPVSASASASSQAQGKGKAKAQPQPPSQLPFYVKPQFQVKPQAIAMAMAAQGKGKAKVQRSLFGEDSDEEAAEPDDDDEEEEQEEEDVKTPAMPFFNAQAQAQGQGQGHNPFFKASVSTSSSISTWSDDPAAVQSMAAWKMAMAGGRATPAPAMVSAPALVPAPVMPGWGNVGGNGNNNGVYMGGVRPGTASGWSAKGGNDWSSATPVNVNPNANANANAGGGGGGGGVFGMWGKKTNNNNTNDMAAMHPFGLDDEGPPPAPVPPIPMPTPTASSGIFGFALKGKKNQNQAQNQNQSASSSLAEVLNKKPSPPSPAQTQSKGKAAASPTVPSPPAPVPPVVPSKAASAQSNGGGPGKGGKGTPAPAPAPVPVTPQNLKKMNKKQRQALLKKGGGAAAQAVVEPEPASQPEMGQEQGQEWEGGQEGEQESVPEPLSVAKPTPPQPQPHPPIQYEELPAMAGFDPDTDADVLAAIAGFSRIQSQNQNQNQGPLHQHLSSAVNQNVTPTATVGGYSWDEAVSTPRPPTKVPRFQQQFQHESMGVGMGMNGMGGGMGMGVQPETPRPASSWFAMGGAGGVKNGQMQMGADGFGMLGGRGGAQAQAQDATIRQPQRGFGAANASIRSFWGGQQGQQQQQQSQVTEPAPVQGQEMWIPGGLRLDDGAGVGMGVGVGGGGGFDDSGGGDGGGGRQIWKPSVSRSPPVDKASSSVPAPGRGRSNSLAAQLLRRNAEPASSSSFSNNQAPDLQSTQPTLSRNNSTSRKVRGKKGGKGKNVTVEEIADPDEEEQAKRDALPSNSRSILESRIMEPKPSVPPHLYNSIIGYEDGEEEEEDGNTSSSVSHSMGHTPSSTAPSSPPDDMMYPYQDDAKIAAGIRQMQEGAATFGRVFGGDEWGAAVNGPQTYVQPQHERWTPGGVAAVPLAPAASPFVSALASGSSASPWGAQPQSQAKVLEGKAKLDPATMTGANDAPTPKMTHQTIQALKRGKLPGGGKNF